MKVGCQWMKTTIDKYYENLTAGTSLLLGNTSFVRDYFHTYNQNKADMDLYFVMKYGHKVPLMGDSLETWQKMVHSVLLANDISYSEMYEALIAEYNPIENYDRYEDTDSTKGSQSNTSDYGSFSVTKDFGAQTETDSIGAGTNTIENTVAPFNSSEFVNDNKTVETDGSRTNSKAFADYTDTDTTSERIDTFTEGQRLDYTSSHIHGNIGVTTNQQMIEAELELRKKHIIDIIFNDIATQTLMLNPSGYDIF